MGIIASTSETWETLLDEVLNLTNTSEDTVTAGVVLSGYTAHNAAGVKFTGAMPNKDAWTGATTGSGNVAIPAGYHNGQGHVSGAGAYNAGVSAADGRVNVDSANYKGGYNAGVSATKKGTAGAGDVLAGKTFTNGSSIGASGTMPNKGTWTGATTGSGNVTIPAGYHNGQGHVSGAGAYNAGVSTADARVNANSANYKGGYNAGVSAADGRVNVDSANYKGGYNAGVSATKKGTAGAGDVLAGKTFTNGSSVGASGTMANKGSTTQDAEVTQDGTYTYLTVPAAGYYNTASKLRTKNSNLRHTINNCFRVTPGTSVLVRTVATLWGTNVNFSGGSVYYLDGITEITASKIAGVTAKLQIIPYNIDNNTADLSNSKNINAGGKRECQFAGLSS